MAKMARTKAWFGDWSNEYDRTLGRVKRHHDLLDLVVRSSGVEPGHRVLDIGCGTGLLSLKFLQKADCRVTGIDISDPMLEIFRGKIDRLSLHDRVTLKRQDAGNPRFPKGTFDIVASTVTLHHLKSKLPAIRKIRDLLKPGGRLLIGDIDMDSSGSRKDPRRLRRMMAFLQEEFALALQEGGIEAFSRMYDNGKKHLLNDGEYCVGFPRWTSICRQAGFREVSVRPVRSFPWFKVLVAIR